jgi:hypothetical protein
LVSTNFSVGAKFSIDANFTVSATFSVDGNFSVGAKFYVGAKTSFKNSPLNPVLKTKLYFGNGQSRRTQASSFGLSFFEKKIALCPPRPVQNVART